MGGASQVVQAVKNPPANAGDIKRHRFDGVRSVIFL